ncbi:MAG: YggU family protein [Thermoleophilia bacterium]|nr:YggU family protein [Thermoleophilia bacterium]
MLSGTPDGTLLKLRVTPGAKKSEIMGEAGGRLRIRLQAPPVEGKANRELVRFIARELGLKKNRVALAGGEKSREKTVLLIDLPLPEAHARLQSVLGEE